MSIAMPRFARTKQKPELAPTILHVPALQSSEVSPDGGSVRPLGANAGTALTLRDPEIFRDRLLSLVESDMAKLTEAGALDEWHREVLDTRIAAEVAGEIRNIGLAAHQRRTNLQGDLAENRSELNQLARVESETQAAVKSSSGAVLAARSRLAEVRTGVQTSPLETGSVGDVHAELRLTGAEIVNRREALERTLTNAKCSSEQQLASETAGAAHAVGYLERQVAVAEIRVAEAEKALSAALNSFRRPSRETPESPTNESRELMLPTDSLERPFAGAVRDA